MKIYEVYIKTESSLDELALRLKEVLNLPKENQSNFSKDQRRSSTNKGGAYYLFEVLGFTLELIRNKGEVEIPERAEWNYYLLIYSDEVVSDETAVATLADHICAIIKKSGIEADVDSLSY